MKLIKNNSGILRPATPSLDYVESQDFDVGFNQRGPGWLWTQ